MKPGQREIDLFDSGAPGLASTAEQAANDEFRAQVAKLTPATRGRIEDMSREELQRVYGTSDLSEIVSKLSSLT